MNGTLFVNNPLKYIYFRGVALGINIVPLHLNVDPEVSFSKIVMDFSELIFTQLGTLSSHVWFVMRWRDTRLRWAASNYENISRVHVGPEQLWRPDIMVYNSVEHYDYETTDLLLTSDGTVRITAGGVTGHK